MLVRTTLHTVQPVEKDSFYSENITLNMKDSIFMGRRQPLHKSNSPYVQRAAAFAKLVDVFSFLLALYSRINT